MQEQSKKFSKTQILLSEVFSERRDILSVLLDDEGKYTIKEIEKIIEDFMKGAV